MQPYYKLEDGAYVSSVISQDGSFGNFKVNLSNFKDDILDSGYCVKYHLNNQTHQAAAVIQKYEGEIGDLEIEEIVRKDDVEYTVVMLYVIASNYTITIPDTVSEVYTEKLLWKDRFGDFHRAQRRPFGNQCFKAWGSNAYFKTTDNGSLYSKDGKTLIHYNPLEGYNYEEILDTVEVIGIGALLGSKQYHIPSKITQFDFNQACANYPQNPDCMDVVQCRFDGKLSKLVIPEWHSKMSFYINADMADVTISIYTDECEKILSREEINNDPSFYFKAPHCSLPAEGHIVTFTQAPSRVSLDKPSQGIVAWDTQVKINALCVAAIQPVTTMDCADEPKCHVGTRILLLGYGLAGLSLDEQRQLLQSAAKSYCEGICAIDVYEDPDSVYNQLKVAGWQGENC